MSVEDKVKDLIAAALDIHIDDVTDDAFLADNLGADPYDMEGLANILNDEFDIEIDEEEVEQWSTVSDVIMTILDKLEE